MSKVKTAVHAMMLASASVMPFAYAIPAQAQTQQALENTTDLATNIGEISESIKNLEKLDASKRLREFKRVTAAIGELAPYLGLISIIGSFATMGQESDLSIILAEFETTNRKVGNLSLQLENAVAQINVGGDFNNQKETVRTQRDMLSSARADLDTYLAQTSNVALSTKVRERASIDFSNAAETAKNRCTGDFLAQAATFYNGNLDRISEVGYYLLNNIQEARDLDAQYYLVKSTWNNPGNRSAATIRAESESILSGYDLRSSQCADALAKALANYGSDVQKMNFAEQYLRTTLDEQGSANDIVKKLKQQYPYLNWVAVKYENMKDYGISAARLRLIRSAPPTRKWDLVIGFYEKKAWFDNARYAGGDCNNAFGVMAAGLPSSGPNGTTYYAPWGDESNLGAALTYFQSQCQRPNLAGAWVALSPRTIDFASSDSATVSQDPSLKDTQLERAGAFFWPGTKRSYLVMPQPAGIAERRPSDGQRANANAAFDAANAAALKTLQDAADRARRFEASTANLPSFGYQVTYTADIDFCHSSLTDTATANNITVEFMVGSTMVAAQTINGSVSDCGVFSRGILTAVGKTDKKVDSVRVTTDGGDAMVIDQVQVKRDGQLFIWDGRDNGGGWCLSTDVNDFRGGWESISTGCQRSITFRNPA